LPRGRSGAGNDTQIVPTESIQSDGSNYSILIFKQVDRINYLWSRLFEVQLTERKENLLELFLSIKALESVMWARLSRDKKYKLAKKRLELDKPETFALIKRGDVAGLMLFTDKLDRFYKLVTRRMDRFNFFPPIELYDFQDLDALERLDDEEDE
jgi:hypothetical protein